MIDPRAIISPKAELAPDVTVGPFSIIGPDVIIGPGCVIGPHVVINGPTRMGASNRVYQFASLGDAPQDKKYAGEPTRLEIGDRNVFRESCTINRGTTHDKGVTTVGSDNLFMAYSHVAHDCVVGSNIVFANGATLGGHVRSGRLRHARWPLRDSSVLQGRLVFVHRGRRHRHARRAELRAWWPATRPSRTAMNAIGLKRRGFTEDQVRNVRNAFRVLYRSDLLLADAVAKLTELGETQPEVAAFVDFIGTSERSLIR